MYIYVLCIYTHVYMYLHIYHVLIKLLILVTYKIQFKIIKHRILYIPHSQIIFTKCFCWFLPNSPISIQPAVTTDKWMWFWHEYWLIFLFILKRKMKVKRQRRMSGRYAFISGMSDFFAELDNSVWILEDCVLDFCSSHSVTAVYTMRFIVDIFATILLSLDNQQNNRLSSDV